MVDIGVDLGGDSGNKLDTGLRLVLASIWNLQLASNILMNSSNYAWT